MINWLLKRKRFKPGSRGDADEDDIVSFYRSQPLPKLMPCPDVRGIVLSTVCMGLGDTMMLTDLPRAAAQANRVETCYSQSQHFGQLIGMNPYWRETGTAAVMVNAPDLVNHHNCGSGHYLQRIRRAYGLKVEDLPRGCIKYEGIRHRNRVVMHFEPGPHALWQRKHIHPTARMLSPETRRELEEFILDRKDLNFFQVGKENLSLRRTTYIPTPKLTQLIDEIAQSAWFIGFMSGPMHVAAALQVRCVIIMDLPEPDKIFMPCLKPTGIVESEWAYVNHVHLHQHGEGKQVKRASRYNLHRAFNLELFPYDRPQQYAALIHERL